MNEIKIYLKPSGSTAELYKDFNLYQGSYRNVQITVFVPTSILYKNADNTFLNTVRTGAIITAPNGAKVTTTSFGTAFVKTVKHDGVEYAQYTQIMPKEYALYAGTQIIVCNVVNIDNTDTSTPKTISVTTSQRAPLIVLESAYLADSEPLEPTEAEVIEGLIGDLQERLNKGEFAARAIYPWSENYTYGLDEITYFPNKGEYGTFIKSLSDDNTQQPYLSDGGLNSRYWQLIADFDILTELYSLKGDITQSESNAAASAALAGEYAQKAKDDAESVIAGGVAEITAINEQATSSAAEAKSSSESSATSAANAKQSEENIAAVEAELNDILSGEIAVPKAESDGNGNNIAEQFAGVESDIQGLRDDFTNENHFKGVFLSVAALKAKYPTATENDFAYISGGNEWVYTNDAWEDSGTPSPNSLVPASTSTPLMDGAGNAGSALNYAKGDHRHPTDTTRASVTALNEETARAETEEAKKADLAGAEFTGNVSAPQVTGTDGVYDGDARVYSTKNPPPTGAQPSNSTPLMDGTATVGTSNAYARGDHKHPRDTGKADTDGYYSELQVGSADILASPRTIITNLSSSDGADFDGSEDIEVGVEGILPTANGGTGNTTGSAASATKLQTTRYIDGVGFNGTANITHYGTCGTAASTTAKTVSLTGFSLVTGARITVKFSNSNTAANPTLNVNGTGAKQIIIAGKNAQAGAWTSLAVISFVYDGTYWIMEMPTYYPDYWSDNNRPEAESYSQIGTQTTVSDDTDTVTDYYRSSDGNSWYRKWSSGWKECGGFASMLAANGQITLPTAFTSGNYTVVASFGGDNYRNDALSVHTKAPSSFKVNHSAGQNNGFGVYWYACGF